MAFGRLQRFIPQLGVPTRGASIDLGISIGRVVPRLGVSPSQEEVSMRLSRWGVRALVVASAVLFVGSTVSEAARRPPRPATNPCEQQCYDEWLEDRAACDAIYADRIAALNNEEALCREFKDPIQLGRCLHSVNVKRRVAANDQRRCYNRANTVAFNCYRACQASQTRP
jgi:hypothetical protein